MEMYIFLKKYKHMSNLHKNTTKQSLDIFFNISFVVSVFLAMQSIHLGFVDFYYYYVFIILSFPLLLYKHRSIDFWLAIVLFYLLILGIINIIFNNNDLPSVIKNILGVSIAFWFYYLIIKNNHFNIEHLFSLYYKFSFFTAIVGFIQFFSFIVGFKHGYDLSWLGLRVMQPADIAGTIFYPIHSFTGEPSAYAFLLSPAIYIAICRLNNSGFQVGSKFNAIVIIVSYILSQSSTGYFAILVVITIINLNRINFSRLVLALIGLPTVIFLLISISTKFQQRLFSSLQLITGSIVVDASSTGEAHGSSLILFNHFLVAKRNAVDHPFGTGIGSHHLAFEKYNSLYVWFTGYGPYGELLNINDASSLFNRILSEMGFVGIICVALFIYSNFLRSGTASSELVMINHASLIAIFTALLRNGHYFIFGLPFFILCYYYTKVLSKSRPKHL
jgi:hypothetical protein